VKLRRDRVVVVLEHKIYVYNFADLKLVDHIETTQNTKGLCALCPYTDNNVLVCPGMQKGHVRVELYTLKKTTLIAAHETTLACFALSHDGTKLATASEKGTLIRIFDTLTGQMLQELRRGADRADIYSISFHASSLWLAVSSDKGTIHVFSLRPNQKKPEEKDIEKDAPKDNPTSSFPSFMKTILPKYFRSEWSFAQFRVPDTRTIVAFGSEKNSIIVVSVDGLFYKAVFDPSKPGMECQKELHVDFLNSNPNNNNNALSLPPNAFNNTPQK